MKITAKPHQEEPLLCKCERDIVLAGSSHGPAIREIYIIECCTAGKGSVIINGREHIISEKSCYVLFPGDTVKHTSSVDNPRQGYSCVLDGAQVGRILSRSGITSDMPFAPEAVYEEMQAQMIKLLDMEDEKDPGVELRRTACIYEMLGVLLKCSTVNSKNNAVQKAIGIMEAYYYEPLSVAELAATVGLERSYFSTLFKEQTGITPHRYLTELRIRKACALIEQSDLNISEIAINVGLDPQNFARQFRKMLGCSAVEYRRR